MQFQYTSASPLELETDLLVLTMPCADGAEPLVDAVDRELGGALAEQMSASRFTGKRGQSISLHPAGRLKARRLLLLGRGDRASFDPAELRHLAATAVRHASSQGVKSLSFVVPAIDGQEVAACAQLVAEGALLGAYRFDKYLSAENRPPAPVARFDLVLPGAQPARKKGRAASSGPSAELAAALARAERICESISLARDLVNEPAAYMTPRQMAAEAQRVAKQQGLTAKVLGPKECARMGMGMFLAVGQGSDEEARLIHLTYRPKGKPKRRIALVGKGVTFDSGGYSLKPTQSMEDMKIDMSGAAAVIASMAALRDLGCPHEVHAVAACVENLVSGRAYKLGDVLKSMSGTTVEITNTDAEGRLTLGDAFTYARREIKPDELLDFATLTGACMVALGPYMAGVFSNDEAMAGRWLAAARRSGEEMWRLPLSEKLREQLKSSIADLKNTGDRYGGALTAGLFLKSFVGDTPWIHVDMAGPASAAKESGAIAKGGTGFGVATILEYLTAT